MRCLTIDLDDDIILKMNYTYIELYINRERSSSDVQIYRSYQGKR